MERPPVNEGGEQEQRIEQARAEAAEQRRRDRARLERYVAAGLDPDDAGSLIEFEHLAEAQHADTGSGQPPPAEGEPTANRPSTEDQRRWDEPANGELPSGTPERPRLDTPRIYVASLADYNNGELHGTWIDADQDPDELRTAIAAMLARSTEEVAEDWAIHDFEGFGPFQVGEYESLDVVSAVGLGIAEYGEAFAAYASFAGTDEEALAAFSDCYLGHWSNLEEYAHNMAEEFGWEAALQQLPENMQPYVSIDYEQVAQFLDSTMNIIEAQGGIYVFSER
jgi:antirestriction protein